MKIAPKIDASGRTESRLGRKKGVNVMAALRWIVVLDGEIWRFRTRRAAREWKARLDRHPANVDIRRFGPYSNVDGVARVVDSWNSDATRC